jgi:hypothetical protein
MLSDDIPDEIGRSRRGVVGCFRRRCHVSC